MARECGCTTAISLNPQTAKNIAQIIKDEFDKKVDILVNNAGITNDKLMIKMKPEEFTKVIDVNLNGAFYMTKAISALMIKQKKRIHHQHVFRISA